MSGWIKIHRDIQNNWIYDNNEYLAAWIKILVNVNYKSKNVVINGKLYTCERGSSLYSIGTWVKVFGSPWSPRKIRTFFQLLEKCQAVVTRGDAKTTRLTVCNYETYQDQRQAGDEHYAEKRQAGDEHLTTTKERKKERKKEESNTSSPKKSESQKSKALVECDSTDIDLIIYTLNDCAKTNYRTNSKKTRALISARLREGHIAEDFKTVIEKKVLEWTNTEHEKYLRPETLFGTKFESYLNQKIIKGGNNGSGPKTFAQLADDEFARTVEHTAELRAFAESLPEPGAEQQSFPKASELWGPEQLGQEWSG